MKLRPFQEESLQKIERRLFAGVNRQLLKLATGLGKTVVFASIPDFLKFNGRVLVLVHRDELAQQAADKLRKWNPTRTVGIEMGDSRCGSAQLVVASVQTLGRFGSKRLEALKPNEFDAIAVDEAHHATASTYVRIINYFTSNPNLLLLGVTATVNRADGTGLGEVFSEIVDDKDILWGIRQGWLADLKCVRIRTGKSLDEVHTKAGDFDVNELSEAINTASMNAQTVKAWLENGQNRQTLVYAVDVQHAKDLADAFQRYGQSFVAIWGADPDRKEKLKLHREGKLKGLVNCQLLTEGYDDWRIGCIVQSRPTQSEGLFTQIVGRGTRIPDNIDNLVEARKQGLKIEKEDCILIDMAHSSAKHSLVSMASLFGLNKDIDFRGKKLSAVMDHVEKLKKISPAADLTKVVDINQFKQYAEQVDLFKIQFPPEVIQISQYRWHKTGDNAYVLLLMNREGVTVIRDLLEKWHIIGSVNGTKIESVHNTFNEAIQEADFKVRMLAGRGLESIVKRKAEWHNDPVTVAQQLICKRMGIVIPPGATKGDVHMKLNQVLGNRKGAALLPTGN